MQSKTLKVLNVKTKVIRFGLVFLIMLSFSAYVFLLQQESPIDQNQVIAFIDTTSFEEGAIRLLAKIVKAFFGFTS